MDFGITLDPTAIPQRHTWEDSDDEEEGSLVELVAVPSTPATQKSRIIFAFGKAASIFTSSYCTLHDVPAYQIRSDCLTVFKEKYFSDNRKEKPIVSEVFKVHSKTGNFLLCIHKLELKSIYCQTWFSLVCNLLQPEYVLILASLKSHQYFSATSQEHGSSHFTKALYSSSWEGPTLAENLEPPNTIIQEPAAVMTYCQLAGVPAAMVVSYTNSTLSMSECCQVFQPLLKKSVLADHLILKSNEEANQKMKTMLPKPSEDLSNLYS